jgi:hypothetical protein
MLSGRRFRLRTGTLALDFVDGTRVAVPIPAGEIIRVISGPIRGDRLLDVMWEERFLTMFSIDVRERGDEISERSA